MSDIITTVDILHPNQIYFHESYENQRLEKICNRIKEEKVIKNPPLVSELDNGNFLLLDGAHRLMAMKQLGCKRVAVQIVPDNKVQVRAWNHILPIGGWLSKLEKDTNIVWSKAPLKEKRLLVKIVDEYEQVYFLYSKNLIDSLVAHLEVWRYIVNLYQDSIGVSRHSNDSTVFPNSGEVLLEFPEYSLSDIKNIVMNNQLMPAGVTRMLISGRLLNLRIPIEFLHTQCFPHSEWEELCVNWSNSLRLYDEPVYMYES